MCFYCRQYHNETVWRLARQFPAISSTTAATSLNIAIFLHSSCGTSVVYYNIFPCCPVKSAVQLEPNHLYLGVLEYRTNLIFGNIFDLESENGYGIHMGHPCESSKIGGDQLVLLLTLRNEWHQNASQSNTPNDVDWYVNNMLPYYISLDNIQAKNNFVAGGWFGRCSAGANKTAGAMALGNCPRESPRTVVEGQESKRVDFFTNKGSESCALL